MRQNNSRSRSLTLPLFNQSLEADNVQFGHFIDLDPDFSTLSLQATEVSTVRGGMPTASHLDIPAPTDTQPRPQPSTPTPIQSAAPSTKAAIGDWSQPLQALLDQPPSNLPKRLALGSVLFCVAFGIWAWLGQVQEVSKAQGKLAPQGEVYQVQPVTSGEIAKIRVKEGQPVQAGQVIAELDNRLANAEIDRLQESLNSYRIELLQTQSLLDRAALEIQTQRAIALAGTQAQEAAIAQAQAKATANEAILPQIETNVTAHQDRLQRLKPLVDQGAIAEDHLFTAEQSLREQQQALTQNQGDLQQTQAEADRLQAELLAKQAEVKQTELEAQQKLQQLQVAATQLKAKITETENLLQAAQTKLKQLFLYAPVSGTVFSLSVDNIGEMAQVGKTIAEIAPEKSPLILSANLPNQEAGLVRLGMPVEIKFDAFPYQDYGIITGKVTSISPNAIVNERSETFYQIEIVLDRAHVLHHQQRIQLKAGQTATAEIVTHKRRIVDVLLDPLRRLQEDKIQL